MGQRVEFMWPPELVADIDEARGDVSRSRWVQRACRQALERSSEKPRPELVPMAKDGLGHKPGKVSPGPRVPKGLDLRPARSYVKPSYVRPRPKGER